MAKLNFGGTIENVVTREEFSLRKAKAVLKNEAVEVDANEHGTRLMMDFQTLGLKGAVKIRTAWIIDIGEDTPRLTSCYVKG